MSDFNEAINTNSENDKTFDWTQVINGYWEEISDDYFNQKPIIQLDLPGETCPEEIFAPCKRKYVDDDDYSGPKSKVDDDYSGRKRKVSKDDDNIMNNWQPDVEFNYELFPSLTDGFDINNNDTLDSEDNLNLMNSTDLNISAALPKDVQKCRLCNREIILQCPVCPNDACCSNFCQWFDIDNDFTGILYDDSLHY